MNKFQVIYSDYSDEDVPYKEIFNTESEAEDFIDSQYSDDLGSDIRINSNGEDEWFTKTGVFNPEENEYFPSARVEPVEGQVDETYHRMQELAGIPTKKNYTITIGNNKGEFDTPKEVKSFINGVFKNNTKYSIKDIVITSKDGEKIEGYNLHSHYQNNY